MEDLRRSVARAFQVEGGGSLEREEFKRVLSLKLNWFKPREAERVVEKALRRGLLDKRDEGLSPAFDVDEVQVPVKFSPAVSLDEDDLVEEVISRICSELEMERSEVVAEANRVQHSSGNLLSMEASLLFFALKRGLRLEATAGRAALELRS